MNLEVEKGKELSKKKKKQQELEELDKILEGFGSKKI
jgi:hypothetical protein